jgi:hypothetical protein
LLLGALTLPEQRWSKFYDLDKLSELYLIEGVPVKEDLGDKFKPVRVMRAAFETFAKPPCP